MWASTPTVKHTGYRWEYLSIITTAHYLLDRSMWAPTPTDYQQDAGPHKFSTLRVVGNADPYRLSIGHRPLQILHLTGRRGRRPLQIINRTPTPTDFPPYGSMWASTPTDYQ